MRTALLHATEGFELSARLTQTPTAENYSSSFS